MNFVHARGNFVNLELQKLFTKLSPCTIPLYYKNNVPRFAFRMIRLLVGMCGAETETLVVARGFSFFYWNVKRF